jgi:pyruvate kinase
MIVIATRSGNTAWISSQSRTRIPMVGISNRVEAMRRMNLLWGIKPLLSERLADNAELVQVVRQWSKCGRELQPGDQIVLVKGTGVVAKAHNTVVVHTIES